MNKIQKFLFTLVVITVFFSVYISVEAKDNFSMSGLYVPSIESQKSYPPLVFYYFGYNVSIHSKNPDEYKESLSEDFADYEETVSLFKDDKRTEFRNCVKLIELTEKGYKASDYMEGYYPDMPDKIMTQSRIYKQCLALKLLQKVRHSKISYIGEYVDNLREYSFQSITTSKHAVDFDNLTSIDISRPYYLELNSPPLANSTRYDVYAKGDFNNDGIEDILLHELSSSFVYPDNDKTKTSVFGFEETIYIITQLELNGKLTILEKH